MPYNLFLDDYRNPNIFLNDIRSWVIVRNYKEFIDIIEKSGLPLFVSFDHDLADEHYAQKTCDYSRFKEKTGYECAKWLVEYCIKTNQKLPLWQVHSMNPVGMVNIINLLTEYKKTECI